MSPSVEEVESGDRSTRICPIEGIAGPTREASELDDFPLPLVPQPSRWKQLVRLHKQEILDLQIETVGSAAGSGSGLNQDTDLLVGRQQPGRKLERFVVPAIREPDVSLNMDEDDSVPAVADTYIRSAIPYLPRKVAILCLVLNLIIPGTGSTIT